MKLNEVAENAYKTALKRQHDGRNVKVAEILKHCAGEVIEAQEAYILWKYGAYDTSKYAEELADVILCALIAAGHDEIDIEKAVNDKMHKNAQRAEMQGDKL